MVTIAKVTRGLTKRQRARLAKTRGVSPSQLAKSYKGNWVKLIKDMTPSELARALKLLGEDELRVVALRAFDGHKTELDNIPWNNDGAAPRPWLAKNVAKELFRWARPVTETRWKNYIAPKLREVGIKSDDTPERDNQQVYLRRIFGSR